MAAMIGYDIYPDVAIPKDVLKQLSKEWATVKPHTEESSLHSRLYEDILDLGIGLTPTSEDIDELLEPFDKLSIETEDVAQEYCIENSYIGFSYGVVHHVDAVDERGFSVCFPLSTAKYLLKTDSEENITEKHEPLYFKSYKEHSLAPVGRQLRPFVFLIIDYRVVV